MGPELDQNTQELKEFQLLQNPNFLNINLENKKNVEKAKHPD